MEAIFHEKQEGSLCAQHCLNALLQGSYFTAVDLAVIAKELDESERAHMAEAGLQSSEYHRFLEQPSSNCDDSGFFSIQVIQSAVAVWDLELVPFSSSDECAVRAQEDPRSQKAYICNFKEHWFTVRRLGKQWFNLNSLLTGPELVSDTYLAMFLMQFQQEGYAIFIVKGNLPDCDADNLLQITPAFQQKKQMLSDNDKSNIPQRSLNLEEDKLKQAMQESQKMLEQCDQSLQKALAESMQGMDGVLSSDLDKEVSDSQAQNEIQPSLEEVRNRRLEYFNKIDQKAGSKSSVVHTP